MKNGTYIKYYLSLPSSYHRINLMKILFFFINLLLAYFMDAPGHILSCGLVILGSSDGLAIKESLKKWGGGRAISGTITTTRFESPGH